MNNEIELTPLQEHERQAMVGDREATIQVVSALRKYRAAVQSLLNSRYGDGFVDGIATYNLLVIAEEIENEKGEDID